MHKKGRHHKRRMRKGRHCISNQSVNDPCTVKKTDCEILCHPSRYTLRSAVIMLAWLTVTLTEEERKKKRKRERKKEEDDLPVLATGTSVMLSSKVNGPVAHENTW